ncbi:delta(14)-sterol reductase LBR-like [Hydractinia symbiolongicarpus]|uniref:delta(14)-sterol reductase LBR-like n=1 Tax=Hydractinia symbiolongicarpus TaxID=13093 RepID=UPI00254DBFA8|nr:delta(14)-sterol reductase LBR-like [Hydractinia symbiolongicarpus]
MEKITKRKPIKLKTNNSQEKDNEVEDKPISKLFMIAKFCVSLPLNLVSVSFPVIFICGLHFSCMSKNACTFLKMPQFPEFSKFFSWKSVGYVTGWFTFQAILSMLPIGKLVAGPRLDDQKKLHYRLNGLSSLIFTMAIFVYTTYFRKIPENYYKDNYISFITGSFIYILLISLVVLVHSRYTGSTKYGNSSGRLIEDFIYGCTVNARLFDGILDLKVFAFKAGFISWAVINIGYLLEAVETSGLMGTLDKNPSLLILVVLQLWYVLDAMIFEEALLYTASLSSEKIGYMFYYSVLCFFPFFCSLQAKYLFLFPRSLSWQYYIVAVFLYVIGYCIYRTSVQQKFNFRKDPHQAKVSGVKFILTANQKDILVDGWWSVVRHPNYLGDWMMCCSWGILCGFTHGIPWLWPVSLLGMLIGMAIRDDAKCKQKYGSSWEEYRKLVKHKMLPYIF